MKKFSILLFVLLIVTSCGNDNQGDDESSSSNTAALKPKIIHEFGYTLNNYKVIKSNLSGFKFEDKKTKEAIKEIYKDSNLIADPHGAVGYLGLKKYLKNHNGKIGVFMETAHPIKFIDVVENTLDIKLKLPERIKKILKKEKRSTKINTYMELKDYLIK